MEGSLRVKCSVCSGELTLRRISDINVAEYRASCERCGWKGSMKSLRCGGCHGAASSNGPMRDGATHGADT